MKTTIMSLFLSDKIVNVFSLVFRILRVHEAGVPPIGQGWRGWDVR